MFVPKPFITILIKGQIAVKNIDLPMKLRRNTKTKRVRKNKRILGQSIEERTSEIEQRQEFGHREIDTVIGKKDKEDQVLLTLTERKTREEFIFRAEGKTSQAINRIIEIRQSFSSSFQNHYIR
ncbi:IS30 family transposase [Aeribacillus pallidus]|uniref:IS30 family transposase n=1 Tax=Aeribacillus TaxID=1055323 RepID=UPI0007B49A60|nr:MULTISPECIES: IS30 family transposase [Aeribacillus]KZM54381.1 hypothetical protein A3Q35_01860 [Aeribacillus pallidus]MED0651415.1 IS30 family transposase [Aeribacillus composti]MED4486685.1 IS30 family transposase [Aeribacillus pallidus]